MKKFIFSLALMAIVAIAPNIAVAQFNSTNPNEAETRAKVAVGKITLINTQNVQMIPKANIYLLQDLKDENKFYVAVDLDDSLRYKIMNKGNKVFYAQSLEIDKPQTEIILRDYRVKLEQEIKKLQEELEELKLAPDKEKKADKKKRLQEVKKKMVEIAEAKKNKQALIDDFKKTIEAMARSTGIFRIIHSEITKAKT